MQGFGVSKAAFAGLFAFTSLGVIVGASVNAQLVRRHVKPKTALDLALSVTGVAALALLAVSLAGVASIAIVAGLSFVYFLAMGLIFPNAMHEAVHPLAGDRRHGLGHPAREPDAVRRARRRARRGALPRRLAARRSRSDDGRRARGRGALCAVAEAEHRRLKRQSAWQFGG